MCLHPDFSVFPLPPAHNPHVSFVLSLRSPSGFPLHQLLQSGLLALCFPVSWVSLLFHCSFPLRLSAPDSIRLPCFMPTRYGTIFSSPFVGTHGLSVYTDDFFQLFAFIAVQHLLPFPLKLLQIFRAYLPMTRWMISWDGIPFFNSIYCFRCSSFHWAKSAICSHLRFYFHYNG